MSPPAAFGRPTTSDDSYCFGTSLIFPFSRSTGCPWQTRSRSAPSCPSWSSPAAIAAANRAAEAHFSASGSAGALQRAPTPASRTRRRSGTARPCSCVHAWSVGAIHIREAARGRSSAAKQRAWLRERRASPRLRRRPLNARKSGFKVGIAPVRPSTARWRKVVLLRRKPPSERLSERVSAFSDTFGPWLVYS